MFTTDTPYLQMAIWTAADTEKVDGTQRDLGYLQRHRTAEVIKWVDERPFVDKDARRIIRHARHAGIKAGSRNYSLCATGINDYLKSEGTLEHAQVTAAHFSPRTTELYDWRSDESALDEHEKVRS